MNSMTGTDRASAPCRLVRQERKIWN